MKTFFVLVSAYVLGVIIAAFASGNPIVGVLWPFVVFFKLGYHLGVAAVILVVARAIYLAAT